MERWVLFDLDGTLTDPKPGITGCIAYALDRLGQPVPSADALTWCIGPPLLGSFETLLGDAGLAPEALRLYRERFSEIGLYENTVYPGIPECLGELTSEGYRLLLATSKPLVYAERIIDHFDLRRFFTGLYGSELDGTRSDKTSLIAHILSVENVDPLRAVMVGDRRHDLIGAAANHVPGIGVLFGYGSRKELIEAGAKSLCETPADLVGAVRAAIP